MAKPGPKPEYTAEQIYEIMRGSRDDLAEPWTAKEVADELGCSTRLAFRRLRELADDGTADTKSVGASARVWWLPIRVGSDRAAVRDPDAKPDE